MPNNANSAALFEDSVYEHTLPLLEKAREISAKKHSDKIVNYKNFRDLFAQQTQKRSKEIYMIFRDGDKRQEFSYEEFYAKSLILANYMKHELGIKVGDRISTFAYNHYRTVLTYYAAWLCGAVIVPINIGEADERIEFIQNNSQTKVCFTMPDLLERYSQIKPQIKCLEHCLNMEYDLDSIFEPCSNQDYAQLITEHEAKLGELSETSLDTEALIVYTSGTTGAPKGVLLQQYQVLVDAHCIADYYSLNTKTRMMIILPIHHVNGLIVTLVTSLYAGGSNVLNRKFSATTYWKTAHEEEASCGSVVPTILSFLCEKDEQIAKGINKDGEECIETAKLTDYQKKNLEINPNFFLICGAGPLTVDLALRFEDKFSIPIIHGYGLSETTAYSCYMPLDLSPEEHRSWLSKHGYPSIGIPLPCNEMAIHDENGNELAEGEKGEIVVRGHNVMKYYFKRPEVNEETFKHGWFRSGDEGFFMYDHKHGDKDRQQFFITGRLKELIIRGGINYSPLEIDEVLNEITGVKVAMAVGFENNAYGEEVGAYAVLEEELNESLTDAGKETKKAEILDYCAKKLSEAKTPKVVILGEHFPVTSTGKYKRNELKPLFNDYKDTQF